jgi:uncharacterized delta-60 repeat protein
MRTLCLLLLCSIVLIKATGQAGSLDPSFGNNGIQTTVFLDTANTLNERGQVVLTNANGDIFVVALVVPDYQGYTRIAKYLPDGRLDSSYGNAGYSNAANMGVTSAMMQGDKIIAGGYTYNYDNGTHDFALARYTADGRLDPSFGVNGIVGGPEGGASSIAIQGDKIIVAGGSRLVRYTADGTLDSSFGVNGEVATVLGTNAITLQGDKIIVTGSSNDFALARYTADGTLDSSFGVNGIATTDFNNSYDQANAIAMQGDKIIVAGFASGEVGFPDFALARYTANGALDSSFGVNGKVTTDFNNSYDQAFAIAMQGDKIIVAGFASGEVGSRDFALARYTANGAMDASFGMNGKVKTDFNDSNDQANAIALQGDKIIVVGYTMSYPGTYDFALARYTIGGALDVSFGEQGLLTGYFPISRTYFTSTVIQGSKIIVAGSALARYTADGTLDSSFGVNGKTTTDFIANAMALHGNKIVVAGYTSNYPNTDFALARYSADGNLDSSFGVNGRVVTNFYGSGDYFSTEIANAIALQGDKIIVAGYIGNPYNRITDFALARYSANGTLDSSFGVNGLVTTNFGEIDHANAIVLQGDKIIAAGHTSYTESDYPVFALARYTADGTLDASFGANGKVTTDFFYSYANAIMLQREKIVVGGSFQGTLVRYKGDGTLDSSFGVNGIVANDISVNSIALQGDKIITGGGSMLVRYTADGNLDSSFGVNGTAITGFGVNAIALHENRLYAVGSLGLFTGDSYGVVAAYQLEATGPTICLSDVRVCESQKQAVLTVHLSAPSTQAVQVEYHTHYITAHPAKDYLSTKYTLQFAPGTTTAKIKLSIVNDSICEATEQFEVILRDPLNATIKDSIGIVTITDDDCNLVTSQQSSGQEKAQTSTALSITASPNPSAGAFTVQLHSSDPKQQVSIRVYDVSGRLLETRTNLSIGQILHLGNQYKAGTYIIEAVQGTRRVQIKVIKTGQ